MPTKSKRVEFNGARICIDTGVTKNEKVSVYCIEDGTVLEVKQQPHARDEYVVSTYQVDGRYDFSGDR